MINVLLNYYNFDGDWAKETLRPHITGKKTLIIPLAFRENQAWDNDSWQTVYGTQGEKYDNIMHAFAEFNIAPQDIQWLNYFDGSVDPLSQIANAEMLFFAGGMPEKALKRMDDLNITNAVKNFNGVVMGASAGAMLQLSNYHITPDEDYDSYSLWQGLGLVKGIDLEVHFLNTPLQNECTQKAVGDLNVPVFQMWHEGGLLIKDGKITPMGNVQIVLPKQK